MVWNQQNSVTGRLREVINNPDLTVYIPKDMMPVTRKS